MIGQFTKLINIVNHTTITDLCMMRIQIKHAAIRIPFDAGVCEGSGGAGFALKRTYIPLLGAKDATVSIIPINIEIAKGAESNISAVTLYQSFWFPMITVAHTVIFQKRGTLTHLYSHRIILLIAPVFDRQRFIALIVLNMLGRFRICGNDGTLDRTRPIRRYSANNFLPRQDSIFKSGLFPTATISCSFLQYSLCCCIHRAIAARQSLSKGVYGLCGRPVEVITTPFPCT
ncbi:hypothetical protein AX279_01695 [Pseudomonas sp. J237]|nr:hypothetical protein AX279_01695 [Pseudomonas sp. J237]